MFINEQSLILYYQGHLYVAYVPERYMLEYIHVVRKMSSLGNMIVSLNITLLFILKHS